jgi:excisionase family DNA binding protein
MVDPPEMLTNEEAAAILRVHPDTLRKWRNTGVVDIPFARIGASVRYARSDLMDWITSKIDEQ